MSQKASGKADSGTDSVHKVSSDYAYKNEEWLRREYVEKNRSLSEIAEDYPVSRVAIHYYVKKFELKSPDRKYRYECRYCGTESWVYESNRECGDGEFCSRECNGKWLSENKSGKDNPNWKGGKVGYGENWYEQRRKALERDNHTCQACGKDDTEAKRIHVHHITPRRDFDDFEKANRLENLVCLCMPCHQEWEGLYLRPDTR